MSHKPFKSWREPGGKTRDAAASRSSISSLLGITCIGVDAAQGRTFSNSFRTVLVIWSTVLPL